ncbi:MAG: hypothetical protein M3309_06190 [Actinomycetota bacterium]|nr:hypothetical protein [Actinomycetota bacterium]
MKRILALLATTALMVVILAMPASAAPIFTGVTVQVPVAAAVSICDTNIIIDNDGNIISCTAKADSRANR